MNRPREQAIITSKKPVYSYNNTGYFYTRQEHMFCALSPAADFKKDETAGICTTDETGP
jgi:hypothetical protein